MNNNTLDNQRFILDILEDQKRSKRRKMDLLKEEFNESVLELELIQELKDMKEQLEPNNKYQQQQEQKKVTTTQKRITNRKGKKPNLNRDHLSAHQKLMDDFFRYDHPILESKNEKEDQKDKHRGGGEKEQHGDNRESQDEAFQSQFKLSKSLFQRIHADLTKNGLHFTQRKDALGNMGHSSYQKVLVAIRQLVHGIGKAEAILDSYIRMAESTALESLIRFCYNMDELYGPEYLRLPTPMELERMSAHNVGRGFPEGLHGYLGFKWWEWEHYPANGSWGGRLKSAGQEGGMMGRVAGGSGGGGKALPTFVLEGLVSHDGWFWAGFLATPGSCKDIPISAPLPPVYDPAFRTPILRPSSVDPRPCYYLAAPIYPPLPPLVSPDHLIITEPHNHKPPAHLQALLQSDFNRAVQDLESRFKIITSPSRLWSSNSMAILIRTTFILHNMIIHHNSSSHTLTPSDIQPSSSLHEPPPTDTAPNIPPHVFAKLNHRYQLFHPTSSLIQQD